MAELVQYYGTGRRNPAARVFLRPGSEFAVNSKPFDTCCTRRTRIMAKSSLVLDRDVASTGMNRQGGGVNGQSGAVRMGVARALQEFNPELRPKLKAEGFLRRDARGKERKKYGQKGARKRFQFSKR
jgi:small subunit ribosomal protein S9